MSTQCSIDHSTAVQSRLLELVGSDTCDITFVLVPSPNAVHSRSSRTSSRLPKRGRASSGRAGGGRSPEGHSSGGPSSPTACAGEGYPSHGTAGRCPGPAPATTIATGGGVPEAAQLASSGVSNSTTAVEEEREGRGGETPIAAEEGRRRKDERNSRGSGQQDAQGTVATPDAAPPPGEREFRCHRVFFAACSDYFRALLYGGMSESRTRRVELRDVAPEGFEAIVKYAYTGRLLVTADNVMEVFSLAHRFDMSELLRACADVLDECMQCDDVCRVLEAAAYYGHADLAAKCWDLIKDSAPRVLRSKGFLELSFSLVQDFVREGELQVDEAELFAAMQSWVDRDPAERRRHVDELSVHFRLPLMSLKDLMSVVRPSGLVAAELLLDAVTYHADPGKWSGDPLMVRRRGRRFAWDPSSSLAAGAWTADENRTVTTSVGDWVGVYGDRVMRSGFHRWSVRANKIGQPDKKSSWKAIIGVARLDSQDRSRPYLPVTGFVASTGGSKLGGNTSVDDYSSVTLGDGDVVTVIYDADAGSLTFLVNGCCLGEAYGGLGGRGGGGRDGGGEGGGTTTGRGGGGGGGGGAMVGVPMVAALAVNSAGAMWSLEA